MNSNHQYRLYSFVANGYLSPLQLGLQTAHAVADMSVKYNDDNSEDQAYRTWACEDKTIIICGAFNHDGVLNCFEELRECGRALRLPTSVFFEDQSSLNGAATACAIVLPRALWDVKSEKNADGETIVWKYISNAFDPKFYFPDSIEFRLISHIKEYRLA